MYDIQNEQILDFWNGLEDIEHRVLRVVDEETFVEDSLRVLRAMQFAARYGFKVEEKSCRLCQRIPLDDLPKERVFREFEKLFSGNYLHYGLYYLSALGIGQQLFDLQIKKDMFMALSRVLQKSQKNFVEKLRPYYFLFICKTYLFIDIQEVLDRLGAPRNYYKKIGIAPAPTEITTAFIANLALKEGIVEYVGNYHSQVVSLAKKLDVWDKPFDRGVTPEALMAEGFSGKELGEELERRTREKILSLKEK